MSFASLEFALFFTVVFGLYLLLKRSGQNRMLLVASYVFYGAWDWRFLSLLLLSTVIDFSIGRALTTVSDPRKRRGLAALSLASNLGILGFFKYAGFFSEGLQDLLGAFGVEVPRIAIDLVLPVGISFYTFQTLSYTLDIYRGRLQPIQSFVDFALFVSFFPQLVAGPIERARHLLPQISAPRRVDVERLKSGSWLVLWGLYKKVVIADNLSAVVDAVYRVGAQPTSGEVILATYAFAWQIYCDFSGYTDIARGIARMMGFDLMLNFDLPYFSSSPAEFWRRWHISLSTWLRDYLYFSLGGNRRGGWLTYRNLGITMVLGGIWHGAAWPFVLWGAYHGVLLVLHRALEPSLRRWAPDQGAAGALYRASCCFAVFHFFCAGWLIFRCESLGQIADLASLLAGPFEAGLADRWLLPFCALTGPLIALQIAQWRTGNLEIVLRWPFAARTLVYAALLLGILTIGDQIGQPFVYFQF